VKGLGPVYALLTVASTILGGFAGLRLRHRLTGAMAFTGGVVLGVALLDVGPEAVDRLGSGREVGEAMTVGFLGFLVLSRLLILHHRDEPAAAAGHHRVGAFGALALSVHSVIDGFGIGAGFALSPRIGALILVAVVGHDFADGMNTVTFVLAQGGALGPAKRWLAIDAVAPEVGALLGAAVSPSAHLYGLGLAAYAGIFVAIGVGELLAEAHEEPSVARLGLTVLGVALMYVITSLLPG
jgi:ZIP family zinc transporter